MWPGFRGTGGHHGSAGIAFIGACSLLCLRGAPAQYHGCTNGTVADIGNGRCDAALNIPSCGYDGGDCCPCTCSDGPTYSCSDNIFDGCVYPDCGDQTADTSEGQTCDESWAGDGYCDADNNHVGCSWDGGDCCECSCTSGPDYDYDCGYPSYTCLDPACAFDPAVVAGHPDCTGDWQSIGDGACTTENNNAACGYDGGDCCLCTCTVCLSTAFECLDPGAGDELFNCEALPPPAVPCSSEVQQAWVVETPAQVRALAAAINCSGGSFEVEWRGGVVVDEPIYVVGGTFLTVSGADTGAVIDGNAATRLFTVTNAVLHLNNVAVRSGDGITGGAIAAVGSSLTFNQTDFIGNSATGFGGAVFVSDGSNVTCTGEGSFTGNHAGIDGGGMFVAGGSTVSCGGSWVDNTAGSAGGALRVSDSSSVWWSDKATFFNNTAAVFGGALSATGGSAVSWDAPTSFRSNSAGVSGGAVHANYGSVLSWNVSTEFYANSASSVGGAMVLALGASAAWSGVTTFTNNTAVLGLGFGGALYLTNLSEACWSASTIFLGNAAGGGGGAVTVLDNSEISWSEGISTEFVENRAEGAGGGIAAFYNSNVFCTGNSSSTFVGNTAGQGGAISVFDGSRVSLTGSTDFASNEAELFGGAIAAELNSDVSWAGTMKFSSNEASGEGGAISLDASSASFSGNSSFDANVVFANSTRGSGGAMSVRNSTATWTGMVQFTGNSASVYGGALWAIDGEILWSEASTVVYNNSAKYGAGLAAFSSNISWSGKIEDTGSQDAASREVGTGGGVSDSDSELAWSASTYFATNTATISGGAVYAINGSSISWTGATGFTSNHAGADGGVVGSSALNLDDLSGSVLVVNGSTSFSNNSCGANGGALALLGGLSVSIGAVDVSFTDNTAGVEGEAVFVSGTGVGPIFAGVIFESNSAQVGGAVSAVGSGNQKDDAGILTPDPTTFERCHFIDNVAEATGGAVQSAAGQDKFLSSVFEGNEAGTGGALRLAGTASIGNCSFVENVSGFEGGAAVSNIGFLMWMENISFSGNVFDCQPGMFLSYNASADPYETACDGCQPTCLYCLFEEAPLVPTCTDALDHTSSVGGTVTLENLRIEPGYWRAAESSEDILACYHAHACLGGLTGTAGYCREGYEGPYCSICAGGYTAGLSFVCSKCSNSVGGIILAVVLSLVALAVAVAMVVYGMSGEAKSEEKGVIGRLARYIPLQSIKIVVVVWQILTQFTSVANITYPGVYQRFLDALDVFNFDLSWVLSAGCVLDVDFHDRLLMVTIGPIIALLFLAATYLTAARVNRGAPHTLQIIWNKHVSMVLLLTFLVYSSVSSVLFKTFACEDLDDGKNYLRSDYRIECDSRKHKALQVYAGLMTVLYTVGIPAFYTALLFRDRKVLRHDQVDREETARVSSMSDLWEPYRPSRFYYEVIECGRRVMLAGVVVFIYPNTAAQIAISLLMAFIFVVVSEGLAPYASQWDTWLSRIGHGVVFVSMYVALLLKVDVANERASSQNVFESLLVVAHGCLILVVVVETVVLACALRVEQVDEPSARFRDGRVLPKKREVAPAEGNPFSGDIFEAGSAHVG